MDVIKLKGGVMLGLLVTKGKMLSGAVSRISPNQVKVTTSDSVSVQTIEGEKKAFVGDWIIKIDDDSLLVLNATVFKKLFLKF